MTWHHNNPGTGFPRKLRGDNFCAICMLYYYINVILLFAFPWRHHPKFNLFVKLAKWEANYGSDTFCGPGPKRPLATPMVLWKLYLTIINRYLLLYKVHKTLLLQNKHNTSIILWKTNNALKKQNLWKCISEISLTGMTAPCNQECTQEFFKGGLKFWENYFALTKVQAAVFTITFMSYVLFQF